MDNSLSSLNPPQREAALHDEGPMLVLAGAGSGKTRVVTERIARLLRNGIPPQRILAVTFTNKAADEMRERLALRAGSLATKGLVIGTFHSFGARFLRQEIHRLGYPRSFTIFDQGDQIALLRQVMSNMGAYLERHDAREVLNRISLAKSGCLSPEEFKPSGDPDSQVAALVYPGYARALKVMGAVDFDDLIYLPVKILQQFKDVHESWLDMFSHVLVDEYQDTNRGQLALVRLLAGDNGNLFVVGDDDQSIYAWRGADHTSILQFSAHYPSAKTVLLTQNYRSTKPILNAANGVIQRNNARMEKELWTEVAQGETVRLVRCGSDTDEAAYVVDDIERRLIQEERQYGDFGILYRTNAQARPIEEHIQACGIPFQVVGGTRFFDRKEIKDFVAYLKVMTNPRDEISLRRIINYPARGIGEATVEALVAHSQSRGCNLWSALREADKIQGLPSNSANAIVEFVRLIEGAKVTLSQRGAFEAATSLLEKSGFLNVIGRGDRSEKVGARRVANIQAILTTLKRHQSTNNAASLEDFISKISLDNRNDDADQEKDPNVVTLMTLHGAKGLEFPVVYLVGMEEGLLPHRPRVGAALAPIHEPNLAEERRLCYVGMTRARQSLTLTLAGMRRYRNQNIRTRPSRFINEIPKDNLLELKREEAIPPELQGSAKKLHTQVTGDFFKTLKDMI